MPVVDELAAALVALLRMGKHFFRLEDEEAQAHGAVAHDAFEMADAAATAELLLGIEADGDMAAFPDAIDIGPAAIPDAVAKGPDAGQFVELAARRCYSCGDGVGVVGDVDRSGDVVSGQGT